jgi:hypothetical protein
MKVDLRNLLAKQSAVIENYQILLVKWMMIKKLNFFKFNSAR